MLVYPLLLVSSLYTLYTVAAVYMSADVPMIAPHITRASPLSDLLRSTAKPARGAPVRAATPPPAVRRPNAGVRWSKLRVLMMRGVSQATQKPVARPNTEVRIRNIQYCVAL